MRKGRRAAGNAGAARAGRPVGPQALGVARPNREEACAGRYGLL